MTARELEDAVQANASLGSSGTGDDEGGRITIRS
jgi:hypothetical protein